MTQRLLSFAAIAVFTGALAAQDVLVTAAHISIAEDTTLSPGRLLVRDGKIAYVGDEIPSEATQDARRIDYGDATILPGFVLIQTTLGQDRDLAESAFPFTPDLRASEAFDPWSEELGRLAASGFTSAGFGPSPRNVAGGIASVCKPAAQENPGRIADDDLHLMLSLVKPARNPNRPPTSLLGAIDMLRTAFDDAKRGDLGGTDIAVVRSVLDGSRRAFVFADTYTELHAALDLAREFDFGLTILGASEADRLLPRLIAQKAAVVLGPRVPEMRLADLRLPAKLAEAGVPFCFAGDPRQIRQSAALSVRFGLDRPTARRALTRTPAILLGQEKHIGSLRQGCDADFAVWSGDPLDLSTSHIATWVDGVRLFGDEPSGAN